MILYHNFLYAVAYVPPEARFRVRGGSLSLSHGGARRARPTLVATGPPGIGAGRHGNDPVALRFRARQLDYTTARFKIASAAICRVRRPAEARSRPTVRRLGCGTPARRGGGESAFAGLQRCASRSRCTEGHQDPRTPGRLQKAFGRLSTDSHGENSLRQPSATIA